VESIAGVGGSWILDAQEMWKIVKLYGGLWWTGWNLLTFRSPLAMKGYTGNPRSVTRRCDRRFPPGSTSRVLAVPMHPRGLLTASVELLQVASPAACRLLPNNAVLLAFCLDSQHCSRSQRITHPCRLRSTAGQGARALPPTRWRLRVGAARETRSMLSR
jgi:hypothetical protein